MAKTNTVLQILDDSGKVVMESGKIYWMRYKTDSNTGSWFPVQVGNWYDEEVMIYTLGGKHSAHNFDITRVDICECRTPDQDEEYYNGKIIFGKSDIECLAVDIDELLTKGE